MKSTIIEDSARNQQTLGRDIAARGRGAHTGAYCTLRLLPAVKGHGITFRRVDLSGAPAVYALHDALVNDDLFRRTTIASGEARIHTVEHLMSAAYAAGIDNMCVELDAPELPFLDGSALPYAEMIADAGIQEQGVRAQHIRVTDPLAFAYSGSEYSVLPSDHFRVSFFFSSDQPKLRTQSATFTITPEIYTKSIAPARTFCFFDEIEPLRRAGLIRGASLVSAVVIGRKHIINDSLRFPDEPVRHKILDFIGDLALLGKPVTGHFIVWRGGHQANAAFGHYFLKELGL